MKVLVGCEFSGIVRQAFRDKGHDAWSCDILPAEDNSPFHYQCDIFEILDKDWDLMVAHPPCTYLTNAGVRHLHEDVISKNGVRAKIYGKVRMALMEQAAKFFHALLNCRIPKVAIENPIPHKYAKAIIGSYQQIIQPWHFGEEQTKAVCLWLKNLPKLVPTNIVGPPPKKMTQEQKRKWHRVHYMPPSKNRSKERSRFFKGIAAGMADQWGLAC